MLWIKTKKKKDWGWGYATGIKVSEFTAVTIPLCQLIQFFRFCNILQQRERTNISYTFSFSTSAGLQHLGPTSLMTRMLLFWNQNWFVILVLSSFIFLFTSCLFCLLSCSLTPILSSELVLARSLARLMSLLGLCLVFTVSKALNSLQNKVFLAFVPFSFFCNVERIWSLLFAAPSCLVVLYWWTKLSGKVALFHMIFVAESFFFKASNLKGKCF